MPLGMDLLEVPWELRHNVFAKDAPYIFGVIAGALNSVGAREPPPSRASRSVPTVSALAAAGRP
jgi:hypothetical protein